MLRVFHLSNQCLLLLSVFLLLTAGCQKSVTPPPVVALNNLPVDVLQLRVISEERRKTAAAIDNPEQRGSLAMALEANGLPALATQEYHAAAILSPNDPLWPYREASARLNSGETDRAIKDLVSVTEKYPGFAPAWHRLATAKLDIGDDVGAENAIEQLQRLVPNSIRARTTAAEISLITGDAKAALNILERVTQEDRQYEWAYMLLGQTYLRLGQSGPVVESLLQKTLEAERKYQEDPREQKLSIFRAGREYEIKLCKKLLKQQRADVALPRLQRAIRDLRNDLQLRLLLAQAQQGAGNEIASMKEIQGILRIDEKYIPAYLIKTNVEIQKGDNLASTGEASSAEIRSHYSAAAATATTALRHAPNDWRMQFARGRAESKLRNDAVARIHLKKALQLEPNSHDICMWLFEVCWRLNDRALAMTTIETALGLDPDNLITWVNLGMFHVSGNNLAEAQKALLRAAEINPVHPAVQSLRGRIASLQSKKNS